MQAADAAMLLREIAGYLQLEGDRHRALAYERGARSIESVADLDRLVEAGRLTELPHIGRSLAGAIEALVRHGSIGLLERLRARWPRSVVELAALPGVGAEKARRLHDALGARDLDEIAALCAAGRVRTLPGFGKVSEARIREAIERRHERSVLLTLEDAIEASETLARSLERAPGVLAVAVCGDVRRWMEVARQLAFAVAAPDPRPVLEHLRALPAVTALEERDGAVHARLTGGVACVVHVAPPASFGRALVLATGSDEHVVALSAHAATRGTTLDAVEAPDEAGFYAALGLPLLPPEVRDGSDEIAAALAGDDFSDLVTVADVAGAVHCHTTYSDGKDSIAAMASAAEERGFSYLTITDHSQSASYAGGLTPDQLREQWDEIARVQRTTPVRLLRGTESDILVDGGLDYPASLLGEMDLVIASIHKRHKLDEDGMTRRLVAALRQPVFKIWGHALGRIILHRDPIPCRFDDVLDAIAESPVAIEINGDPRRLDLDPVLARQARERGARFVLSTDAHSTRQLDHVHFAVGMARRARIRRHEVLNALPADEFARAVRPDGGA